MKALDLFCGAGGTGMGLHRAGFEVTGVDVEPQKRYPFEFVLGDALEYCAKHGHEFDLIVGGPPCQPYTRLRALATKERPRLIGKTRQVMKNTGRPYIIENVLTAWRRMDNPIMLCGTMFPGLRVLRHRLFECSPVVWFPPAACNHWGIASACGRGKSSANKRGYVPGSLKNFDFITVAGNDYIAADGRQAMGIDWMVKKELSQAIPPAYTEWLGREMLKLI